jgi:hypothetical protein
MFDLKRNGVIDFGEFVRSLNIFHPDTPDAEKISCKESYLLHRLPSVHLKIFLNRKSRRSSDHANLSKHRELCPYADSLFDIFLLAVAFRLYDLRGTGFIEREEVYI